MLKGRQSAAEAERIGLRLRLRKQRGQSGDIVLLYGPKPSQPIKPVVLVDDTGQIQTSKLPLAAITASAHWLTVELSPEYAPELNDFKTAWHNLKTHHLAHQTFADANAFDHAIHRAVAELNRMLTTLPLTKLRIPA